MGKRIVLFSDGTGNSSAKAQKTNVWRLFQALDQTHTDQIAKYDDGVGTSSNKYLAAFGGAFGWGLKRNVIDLYKFVCRNYERDDNGHDDIYGFGFSRGAFTIRVLVDFIATEGLVTFRSEEELKRNAAAAYRHYRAKQFPSWSPFVIVARRLRDVLFWAKDRIRGYRTYKEIAEDVRKAGRAEIPIRFLGLWDTVEAYGVPLEELKRGIDWVLWPMLFGDLILSPRVQRACHALSLDDERATFHPLLWDEVAEADMVAKGTVKAGRITQVWFSGVHTNVGGGYPEDQLSLVSLDWMMGQAIANGLTLDANEVKKVTAAKSPYARLYDSRAGVAAYYRYAPRQIWVRKDTQGNRILPIIHGSAIMRMAYGSDQYSPISPPHEFWVLAPDGELLPMEGAPLSLTMDDTKKKKASEAPASETLQTIADEKAQLKAAIAKLARPDRETIRLVWDTVFWRRGVYFLTVALTVVLVAYPWLGGVLTKAAHLGLRSIPIFGRDLDERWHAWLDRLDDGSRGPITSLVDAVSGFIPSYLEQWIKALEKHPIEFASIAIGIMICMAASSVLQARIHDRARLAWRKEFRKDYDLWLAESQKGWRNGVVVFLALAALALLLAYVFGERGLIKVEISIVVAAIVGLLILRSVGGHLLSPADPNHVRSTFALSAARFLRNNRFLQGIHKWVFGRAIPIAFALLLVVLGLDVVNRALFDGASAAGVFCKSSVPESERKTEKLVGARSGFTTDQMCWPSGLVLKEGKYYRIKLATPGDWFDQTIRADVGGFAWDNIGLSMGTPLRRWWGQNWFKPIARIGEVGNDEYVLEPPDPFDDPDYPACEMIKRATDGRGVRAKIRKDVAQELMSCASTPPGRRIVTGVIKARSTGELFLYVNDAVLMWPGRTDQFFANNSGTGSVAVDPVATPEIP